MAGKFLVEKNSLRVFTPESIRGNYDSAIGNFGIPKYGGTMAGAVVYPKENTKGCQKFETSGISFKSKPGALPTFVLVDRGGTFCVCVILFYFGIRENKLTLDLILHCDMLL